MMTNKRGRKPKYVYTIVLSDINVRSIYKEYRQKTSEGLQQYITPIIAYSSKNIEASTTPLTNLNTEPRTSNAYYDANTEKKVIMLDHVNYGCLPERTDIWCFHCVHSFSTSPIGVPIKYVKKKLDKIQEPHNITGLNDYFLTYGIFCSFPCCLAFIEQYKYQSMFRTSKSLLFSLYYKIFGTELKINKAPSWECLQIFGGTLSIEKFRASFCNTNYVITDNIKRPYMVAVGRYIEEHRCRYF